MVPFLFHKAYSEGKYIHTITLSYTFYEIDLPEKQAALQVATTINRN